MFTLNCKGRLIAIDRPVVMGIINITPDSFYSNSRQQTEDAVLQTASAMLNEGAFIVDIGAQSTRPGSSRISAIEESERLLLILETLIKHNPEIIISVDTYHASVAVEAINAGASIINDISGGLMDSSMLETAGKLKVPYICMHMKGSPETMQQAPAYDDVIAEVLDFFIQQVENCRQHNILDVIIDPGFGFGKTITHNFRLLKNLSAFKMLNRPILAGLSRKGTIYKTLKVSPEEALNGTTALNMIALLNGANILRVHDVKEAVETITLFEKYQSAG